jgi:hypothetical protein
MMRVLTVQQPAAGAIVALGKDVENRTWTTKYRGPVAIQAGAATMPAGHPFWRFEPYRIAYRAASEEQRDALRDLGAIIAVVELVDCHFGQPGCCESPWAERMPFPAHWVIEDVRPLSVPIAWKGALGLRALPEDVERDVLRRLS